MKGKIKLLNAKAVEKECYPKQAGNMKETKKRNFEEMVYRRKMMNITKELKKYQDE